MYREMASVLKKEDSTNYINDVGYIRFSGNSKGEHNLHYSTALARGFSMNHYEKYKTVYLRKSFAISAFSLEDLICLSDTIIEMNRAQQR